MSNWVTLVTSRLGIILIAIGVFLAIRPGFLNLHGPVSHLLEKSLSTYLGIGLLTAGAIIFVVFIYNFFEEEKKKTAS